MNHCQDEMKKAVKAGYWNLFSFNPALKAEGKNPFTLTSKAGDGSYQEFLNNEARYTRLIKPFQERAEKLFAKSEETAKARYTHPVSYTHLQDTDTKMSGADQDEFLKKFEDELENETYDELSLIHISIYGSYHHITVLGKEDAPCDHTYDVVGSLLSLIHI